MRSWWSHWRATLIRNYTYTTTPVVATLCPLCKQWVQPYSPLYWIILRTVAFAGKSNDEPNSIPLLMNALAILGEITSIPWLYMVVTIYRLIVP